MGEGACIRKCASPNSRSAFRGGGLSCSRGRFGVIRMPTIREIYIARMFNSAAPVPPAAHIPEDRCAPLESHEIASWWVDSIPPHVRALDMRAQDALRSGLPTDRVCRGLVVIALQRYLQIALEFEALQLLGRRRHEHGGVNAVGYRNGYSRVTVRLPGLEFPLWRPKYRRGTSVPVRSQLFKHGVVPNEAALRVGHGIYESFTCVDLDAFAASLCSVEDALVDLVSPSRLIADSRVSSVVRHECRTTFRLWWMYFQSYSAWFDDSESA